MALTNRKSSRVWFTAAETRTGNENSPDQYASATGRFEGRGVMTFPTPSRQIESDKNKLGSGEHGKAAQLMTIATPWSYKTNRPEEIGYLLAYFMGSPDVFSGHRHTLYHLGVDDLELPSFGFQYFDGVANKTFAGAVVNEFNFSFPFQGGNGQIEATFSGWCNAHYVAAGVITQLANGSLAAGPVNTFLEPIVNVKSCSVWLADALEPNFSSPSIEQQEEDLGANLIDITALINSATITGNNGMSMEDKIRAGGWGIINDFTRGVRAFTCELNVRKDESIINWDTLATARTQKSIELEWNGPVIATTESYLMDLFFPVVEVNNVVEDDNTPIGQAVTTEIFQDSSARAMIASIQSSSQTAFFS